MLSTSESLGKSLVQRIVFDENTKRISQTNP